MFYLRVFCYESDEWWEETTGLRDRNLISAGWLRRVFCWSLKLWSSLFLPTNILIILENINNTTVKLNILMITGNVPTHHWTSRVRFVCFKTEISRYHYQEWDRPLSWDQWCCDPDAGYQGLHCLNFLVNKHEEIISLF